MDTIFQGLFDSTGGTSAMGLQSFLICTLAALIIGIIIASVYSYKSRYTKSFIMTLIMLPAIVAVVIMMVNGNIGAGVAVAGAFSLVRFRSVPGTAKEIATIFLAMGAGLICGMGYIGYAFLFTIIMGLVMVVISATGIGGERKNDTERRLKITVPEDLNYSSAFEEVLDRFTSRHDLMKVKTTAMGSLYKLTYDLSMRDPSKEKELIDELRIRNGNLEIAIMRQGAETDAL